MRVLEKRVLAIIFERTWQEARGRCKMLHNDRRSDWHSSANIMAINCAKMSWMVCVAWMGEKTNVHILLVGPPKRKRFHGRSGHKREENVLKRI